jgi:PAS domain S-box-containing protein
MARASARRHRPRPLGPTSVGDLQRELEDLRAQEHQSRAEFEHLTEDQHILEESRDHYAALFDSIPIALVLLDAAGIVEDVNPPASRLLAVPRLKIRGGLFKRFVAEADRPTLAWHLRRCRLGEEAVSELILTPPNRAAALPIELRSSRIGERHDRYVTAVLDVSDRRRLQADRARLTGAEREAREASRAKDNFIAVLSHELRSPLTPVLAAVTAIQSGRLPAFDIARLCETIHRSVLAESRLIDDLLDVTRIVSGKIRVDKRAVDLHDIAKEALEALAEEFQGKQQAVTVQLDAVAHSVDGDALRLRQVIANLLRNAVKFTPERGEITVRSWNKDGNTLIEVSDSGIGIAPHSLQRIFNPFEQAEDGAREGGLGLGLAICKGIVDLHGGTIVASSGGQGKGARFVVELPTCAAAPHETEAKAKLKMQPKARTQIPTEGRAPGSGPPDSAPGPSRGEARLLLVEDNRDIAESLSYLLRMESFDVRTVSTAQEALALDLADVDLVISDLGLPDLSGHQLMRLLQKKRKLPGIALSGYGTETDVRASRAAGFAQHLTKPVDLNVLLHEIRTALSYQAVRAAKPARRGLKPAGARRGARSRSRETR